MATVGDVAREVLAAANVDVSFLLVVKWINDRYMELCSTYPMSHKLTSTTVNLSTVTDVQYDTSSDIQFWGTVLYHGDLLDAGAVPTRIVHRVTIQELDDLYSSRVTSTDSGGPRVYAEVGVSSSGKRLIEIYPCPHSSSDTLKITYYAKPAALSVTSDLPAFVDSHILRNGALVDLYMYLSATAQNKGDAATAEKYAKDAERQLAIWQRSMGEAAKADKGRLIYDIPLKYPLP